MTYALKDLPKEEFKKPDGVYTYSISKLSGNLATKDTPENLIRSTIMAVKLTQVDGGLNTVEVDTLCNGVVTPETPLDARATLYIPTTKPIIDGYDPAWYE